jgi:hypothetical protein
MGARLIGLMMAGALLSAACEQTTSASEGEAEAEQLPEIVPSLPEVPTLPPPPFPTTYEDDSYSVYPSSAARQVLTPIFRDWLHHGSTSHRLARSARRKSA